ncbi:hypothetical protein EGW08_017703 [Elysia chlorotica]|uniref:Uncharacterized protein n=1 Tax=Elysia chlorotica TaxID=188477 RepID=A0A433SYZ8_ELYCH|nr:hypothetical protein EGW08_017703 [Elysia chlorotica]
MSVKKACCLRGVAMSYVISVWVAKPFYRSSTNISFASRVKQDQQKCYEKFIERHSLDTHGSHARLGVRGFVDPPSELLLRSHGRGKIPLRFLLSITLYRAHAQNGIEGAPCLQFPPLEPQEPRPDWPSARTQQGSSGLGAGAFHAPSRLESSHWSDQCWAAQRSSALPGRTRLWGEGRKAPGIPAQCGKQQKRYPREFLPQYLRIVWPSSRLVLVVLPSAQGTLPSGHPS